MPRATFLMTVYNAAPYLQECINSILNQSIGDFELWIIDDGSLDDSAVILENQNDKRIKKFYNSRNLGIADSLNQYLHEIKTEYILRMDADDICLPHRLEKQIAFMDAYPAICLSGGALQYFGKADYTWFPAETNEEIKARLYFNSAIPNPTLIMRSAWLRQYKLFYNKDFREPPMEDYALLIESMQACELGNLKEILVRHREHDQNQSNLFLQQKEESMIRIYKILFDTLGLAASLDELQLHYQLAYNLPDFNKYNISDFINWSNVLIKGSANNTELKKTMRFYLFKLFLHLKTKPLSALQLMLYLFSL